MGYRYTILFISANRSVLGVSKVCFTIRFFYNECNLSLAFDCQQKIKRS